MSDSTAPEEHVPLGTVLAGRYRVTRLIGSGGMGVVYQAEHVHMRKAVAIKVLHRHMTTVPEVVARFEREAVAAARIEHPNVALATDFGRLDDGSFYLALEYVEGRSLSSVLREGALPVVRALVIARQIADGLAAAHAAGIVHRDLKPENVMLVERDGMADCVKMLDFGIAKVRLDDAEAQSLTQIGTVFGTPQYMSPEQGQGHVADARSDLYALGVILYEMLAGKLPFEADDLVVLITRHICEAPPPLPDSIPLAVRELVFELLEKEPRDRIQSASELLASIDRLLKDPTIAPAGSIPPNAFEPAPARTALGNARTALGLVLPKLDFRRVVPLMRRAQRALRTSVRVGKQEVPRYALLGAVAVGLLPPLVVLLMKGGGPETSPANAAEKLALDARPPVESAAEKRRKVVVRAEAGDREALAELDALPGRERGPSEWRARARGRCALGELSVCIAEYKAAVLGAPSLKRDAVVLSDVRRLAESAVAYEEAMRLSAHHLGASGVDILFDVWKATRSQKDAQVVNRRARQFLEDGSVRNQASKELRLVLDLERAEKKRRCKDARELVPKAAEYGDDRVGFVLDKLASGRGCGIFGLGDCWGCLRGNKDLDTARKAAAGRPGPAFTGEESAPALKRQ